FNAYAKEFNQKLEEYYIIRNQIIDETLKFEQNITCISSDGKYVAAAASVVVPNDDPASWRPFKELYVTYIFNLADDTMSQLECKEGIVPSTITDNGDVFCGTIPDMMSNTPLSGFVGNVASTETQPLVEYLSTVNPAYSTWMVENCSRMTITGYDPDTYEPIEENIVYSGRPFASADGKTMATAIDFVMDEDEFVTVFFPASSSAISNVASDLASFKVNASVGGVINVNGQAASIAVYDLSGRVVFTADAVEGAVSTGLNAGVYVVKAVAADGQTVTEKVAF
ncbi:MAG: T9SS type A sorting domain-containing protein, partial [Duncaniella sp.]|nr:T9SS type A sorting domain-containing protein [Duncaniella sp.]